MKTLESRLRLDNAANIYPASLTKHYCTLFRLRVTFTEDIDRALLSKALWRVSQRIPTFRCKLTAGPFWWYLSPVDNPPEIHDAAPFRAFDFRRYGNHIYRVCASGKYLILDVFHALTDGGGGKTFILSLAAEYCRLRYGITVEYGNSILYPDESFAKEELQDSFMTVFHGRKGKLEKDCRAYHVEGAELGRSGLMNYRLKLPVPRLKEVCARYNCTVTEFITACLLASLQYVHTLDRNPIKRNVIKVSVPVDLRPRYGSRTLRNFSTYINIGVDLKNKRYSLEGLIKEVAARKRAGLLKENLETKIAANVELEENIIVRAIPLFIKKFIIDSICRAHGDKLISYTFSNLCAAELPAAMAPYVSSLDFYLGRQRGNSGGAACISLGDTLYLNLTRKIRDSRLEEYLIRLLEEQGVPVKAEEETLA